MDKIKNKVAVITGCSTGIGLAYGLADRKYSGKNLSRRGMQFISFILLITLPFISFAQIQGTIHDKKDQPVSFANVLLIDQKDSSLVTGIMTSDVGTFSITNFTPGKYLIKTSMLGYKTALSQPFEITSPNSHVHLNPIIIEEDTELLSEVRVVGKKPIYELQIDRMVVNVENSITSTGTTALEILEKSPGVIVDRQNKTLSMGGKAGVLFMINGKESRMPMEAAIEMLGGMSSENIKKIELITSPSSKYEAEGDAGIINIVFRKDDTFGTNGNYSLGAGMGMKEKMNGGISLNHHEGKLNFFGLYSYSYDNSSSIWNANRKFYKNGSSYETNTESNREPIIIFHNARLGFDYTISSKTILGVLATGYIRDYRHDAFSNIYYKRDNEQTTLIDQYAHEINVWSNYTGNINIQHTFKKDEILEFNADYLYYNNYFPTNYEITTENIATGIITSERKDLLKKTPIYTSVAKLDYTHNFGENLKLETGLKYTDSRFENNVSVKNQVNNIWTTDLEFTHKYNLSENISAAYSSIDIKFSKKTNAKAGLRYEYTNTVLSSETEHGIISRHYGRLFPAFFLSYELTEGNTLQFSYSRRITRPTYNELAPFILFQTPNSYVAGNDKLQPSTDDILKLEYKLKTFLISLTNSIEHMAISSYQPGIDLERNIQYLTSKNLDWVGTWSLILSVPVKLTSWWTMQKNISVISQNIRTEYDGAKLDLTRESFRINTTNNFKITDRINGEISGFYQSASFSGISKSNSFSIFSAGLQMKSKNEKSSFSLNFSDLFKGYRWFMEAYYPELNINSTDFFTNDSRVFRFTYSHKFGSNKIKAERKRETGSEEERKRVN